MLVIFTLAAFIAAAAAKDGKDFVGPEYISLSRQAKSDKIWAKVTEKEKSGSWHLAGALIVSQAPVFDTKGDELECYWDGCRNKTIHAQGNVGKIEWVSEGDHPYTGMFKGADTGYVRFSVAAPVDSKKAHMLPGMAVKLLRNGMDSANFVAMYSVDGQYSLNFFANDFSNHVPDSTQLALKPGMARFATQTNWIQTVGLSEMASMSQEGTTQEGYVFPWRLNFKPTGEFMFPDDASAGYVDFKDQLKTIPSGSVLYDVYALDQPEELGGTEQLIARIRTTSELRTSYWGDEHMYFRHQRMDQDLKHKPEWEPYTPKYTGMFSLEQEDNQASGCPFAEILDFLQ